MTMRHLLQNTESTNSKRQIFTNKKNTPTEEWESKEKNHQQPWQKFHLNNIQHRHYSIAIGDRRWQHEKVNSHANQNGKKRKLQQRLWKRANALYRSKHTASSWHYSTSLRSKQASKTHKKRNEQRFCCCLPWNRYHQWTLGILCIHVTQAPRQSWRVTNTIQLSVTIFVFFVFFLLVARKSFSIGWQIAVSCFYHLFFCLSCLFYTWMATFVTMYGTMKISIYMWFRSIVVSHYSRYTYYVFYFASLREKNTKQEITDKWDMVANWIKIDGFWTKKQRKIVSVYKSTAIAPYVLCLYYDIFILTFFSARKIIVYFE